MNLGIPPRAVALRLVRSAISAWVVVRLMVALLGIPGRPPLGSSTLVIVVLVLAWLNLRRAKEQVLFANLGIQPLAVASIVVLVAVLLETILWVSIGLWQAVTALTPHPPLATDA